jgi:hypothetical protein
MGLIREPKNVDFLIKSEPWTKDELAKLREIMKKQRDRKAKLKSRLTKKSGLKDRVGKGEFHSQTSHRTVLDSLPSHGSS